MTAKTAQEQIEAALKGKWGFRPTDGPWFSRFDGVSATEDRCVADWVARSMSTRGKTEAEEANNNYIAACNPANMRELLADLAAKDAEIARLSKCLADANSNAENFERKWYLLGDEVERLRDVLGQTKMVLLSENENPTGAIRDTIWYSNNETLFDYIDAALTTPKG